jgi:rare lipoprotein A
MGRGGVEVGLGLIARLFAVCGCGVMLAQCGQAPSSRLDPKYGVSASPRLIAPGEPVPKGGGVYRVGKPYTIAGRTYEPELNPNYSAEGLASWYGEDFHGRATANGEVYDMSSISAAHPTLPIPSYARVTNLSNRKSIIVRVNDRGPYHQNRLIDVSVRTAKLLGFYDRGLTKVRVDYLGRAALEGSDDTKLADTLRSGTPAPGPAEFRVASSQPVQAQSATPVRGPVPLPADRPFELGHNEAQARVAKRSGPVETAAVTRQPIAPVAAPARTAASTGARLEPKPAQAGEPDHWERGFAARFAPAANLPTASAVNTPVSAFAAPTLSNGAILSGRGLY